ncbi:hypothetical protein N7456_002293 [Penicillium angulare]|uniref:Serine hydrolase domain-containing protein n=1 Tax=Penicillium angulare TaxID=116970 RepID=A0A9W9KNV6_9EURO|nr:hypothetical protein N7456_002293 [Penicillium angulare]
MHFLCLHGVGTNARILELQTVALRYGLGPGHTYDFVEGAVEHPMEPHISNLVSPGDTFHAYFEPASGHSMLRALQDLENLIEEADPPYDAVLGFSHGSTLVATMLLKPNRVYLPFKLAVFFSAGMAADHEALKDDHVKILHPKPGQKITIPTAHVYAANDEVSPGQGKLLEELCDSRSTYVSFHQLGHQIPGTGDKKDLAAALGAVRRAIEEAEEGISG